MDKWLYEELRSKLLAELREWQKIIDEEKRKEKI